MSLSSDNDCVVAVNGGSLNSVQAGSGDDLICGGVFDDVYIYGARSAHGVSPCAGRGGCRETVL